MNISRKSWHCRFLQMMLHDQPLPRNLCSYFSATVFMLFGASAVAVCLIVLLPVILPLLIMVLLAEKWKLLEPRKPTGTPEPKTVLGRWLKVKKDKVCPLIEYIDY